jgi:hypothetical protein
MTAAAAYKLLSPMFAAWKRVTGDSACSIIGHIYYRLCDYRHKTGFISVCVNKRLAEGFFTEDPHDLTRPRYLARPGAGDMTPWSLQLFTVKS